MRNPAAANDLGGTENVLFINLRDDEGDKMQVKITRRNRPAYSE